MDDGYRLELITPESLNEIEKDWLENADEDVFELELAIVFDHFRGISSQEHGENDAYIFGLFDNLKGSCLALAEMVSSKRRSVSKLLKVTLSPVFIPDLSGMKESEKQTLAGIYKSLFMNIIIHEGTEGFDEVRIYARTPDMFELLDLVAKRWNNESNDNTDTVSMKGRWLVISHQPKG
ncbi:hypothetical protein [Rothia mucilaginosa]